MTSKVVLSVDHVDLMMMIFAFCPPTNYNKFISNSKLWVKYNNVLTK